MRKHLYVNGTDLATFGVYISGQGTFGAPNREYTFYEIPGRDGSVPGVNTRLRNIKVSYECFIFENFETNIRNLRSFLLAQKGYVRITDDYDTTHFRMGIYEGPFEPNVTETNNAAKFTLTFNCKPQRWLLSGETPVAKGAGNTVALVNPTLFVAKPFIRVWGYGQVYCGVPAGYTSIAIEIDDTSTTYVDIDCETMNAYYQDTNLNSYVGFKISGTSTYGQDAPTLPPGTSNFGLYISPSTITNFEITPRWWEV